MRHWKLEPHPSCPAFCRRVIVFQDGSIFTDIRIGTCGITGKLCRRRVQCPNPAKLRRSVKEVK